MEEKWRRMGEFELVSCCSWEKLKSHYWKTRFHNEVPLFFFLGKFFTTKFSPLSFDELAPIINSPNTKSFFKPEI